MFFFSSRFPTCSLSFIFLYATLFFFSSEKRILRDQWGVVDPPRRYRRRHPTTAHRRRFISFVFFLFVFELAERIDGRAIVYSSRRTSSCVTCFSRGTINSAIWRRRRRRRFFFYFLFIFVVVSNAKPLADIIIITVVLTHARVPEIFSSPVTCLLSSAAIHLIIDDFWQENGIVGPAHDPTADPL